MAFNATVTKVDQALGDARTFQVEVLISDGQTKYEKDFVGSGSDPSSDIISQIQAELVKANTIVDVSSKGLAIGTVIQSPTPAVPDPNIATFLSAKAAYQHQLNAVSLGIIAPGSKSITDALATLTTAYNAEPAVLINYA